MQFFGRLLNRAILSHLLVAVPPAVLLGAMVLRINEVALREETQQLHLSIASQFRDAILGQVAASAMVLGHAERILDLSDLEIGTRQDMLRALVADQRVPYVGLYRPDGSFDSLIRPRDGPPVDRSRLPDGVRARAENEPWTVWADPSALRVVLVWRQGADVLGYLATTLDEGTLQARSVALVERYLGKGGAVDVVAPDGRAVLSARVARGEVMPPEHSALAMVKLSGQGGLTALEAGIVGEYVDTTGGRQLGAIVSAPRLGWLVTASRAYEVAFASLVLVRTRVILMSIIAALAAGLVGLLLARQISGPVQRLIQAVRRAAQRGFAPDSQVQAQGELGQLAAAFNHAVVQMDDYRRQVRYTTQLRLRLSRFAPNGTSARDLLARADLSGVAGPVEPMVILYADVVFDDPDVDTEHLVTILGEFFAAAHEATRQEGGRIDRFSGDAVIGLFPAAGLSAPLKAASAAAKTIIMDARAIAERWSALSPIRLSASVGLVSGDAQLVVDDAAGEPTVQGALVERAAYLQSKAKAGTAVVDARVAEALQADGMTLASANITSQEVFVWTPIERQS